ncbi:MAG: NAD(P)-binding domain-containing protein [Chloroflexi bacterium]|nr:NAD(P)-binding domain-containing protein [Chloroflexota bacterium]
MAGRVLFLSAADGDRLLASSSCYVELAPRLAEAMKGVARGETSRQNRTSVSVDKHSLMAGPAVGVGLGAGIRLYTGIRGGPRPKAEPSGARLLFDYSTMALQMVAIEGNLHAARTAAGGAVVARALAVPRPRTAIIGSGRIASQAARAVVATCAPSTVSVFSPTPAHRDALASAIGASTATSLEQAVASADLVVSCTEATPPALDFSAVPRGAIVVSLGLGELSASTIAGGQLLCTGLKESLEDERGIEPVRMLAGEARDFFDVLLAGTERWDRSRTTWVAALGTAVWDLAFVRWLYDAAVGAGVGTWLEA